MKYLKTILLAFLGKQAKAHEKEIKKAQNWIDSAQAQFASAIEESEKAEQHFDEVAQTLEAKLRASQATLSSVLAQKEQATKFKQKMKKFIED